MSLDLYEIGENLILDDGISSALDGVIGKVIALQEVTDRVNGVLGHSSTALAGLTSTSDELAKSWNLAAEAAERVAGVVDKVSIGGSELVPNTSNAAGRATAGDYSAIPWGFSGGISQVAANDHWTARHHPAFDSQYQTQLTRSQDVSNADVLSAIGAAPSLRTGPVEASQEDATSIIPDDRVQAEMRDGTDNVADANAFGPQMGNASYVMPGFGESQFMVQHFSQLLTNDPLREMGGHNPDPPDFEPVENLMPDFRPLKQVWGGDIMPQDQVAVFAGTGPDDWETEGCTFLGDAARTSAVGAKRDSFAVYDPVRISDRGDEGEQDGRYDTAGFEPGPPSWIPAVSEKAATRPGLNDSRATLDALPFENSLIPDAAISAVPLFQHDVLPQYSTENGVLPEVLNILTDPDLESEHAAGGPVSTFDRSMQPDAYTPPAGVAALDGLYSALDRLGDWTKTYPRIGSDIAMEGASRADAVPSARGVGSSELLNNFATEDSVAGAETGEAAAFLGAEGIATASGPPGWLVALTGAVVMELTSTMFRNNASTLGGPTASRQNQLGPSGTRNDPMHVRVVDQQIQYSTHMPAGPTSTLPSQSLPIPGQVLFSP